MVYIQPLMEDRFRKLSDIASNVVAVPLNDDDVLTFDVGISAYTSASSSNNPYDESGASGSSSPTPWQASSGASRVNWPG
jgi:hypothetical protein